MQGPESDPGVNTRALGKLFEVAAERFPDIKYEVRMSSVAESVRGERALGWKTHMHVLAGCGLTDASSCSSPCVLSLRLLEIYNEKIQDLLGEKGRVLKAVQGQYGMEVQDLTMVSVANQKEVLDTLKKGSKNRSVTATNMNDVSSRSHLILSVYVMARNNITGKDTMGKLHLIDLAGSERVGRSGVQGEAMKEVRSNNKFWERFFCETAH